MTPSDKAIAAAVQWVDADTRYEKRHEEVLALALLIDEAAQPQRSEKCNEILRDTAKNSPHAMVREHAEKALGAASSEPQEWTRQLAERIVRRLNRDWGNEAVALMIEAATNAERECGKAAFLRSVDMELQLAAERERTEQWRKLIKGNPTLEKFADELVETRQELLAAQAAIQKHNKEVLEDDGLGQLRHLRVIVTDLSALEEYRKEVRKPLVEALVKVRRKFPIAANTDQLAIVQIIEDALAGVKEGK